MACIALARPWLDIRRDLCPRHRPDPRDQLTDVLRRRTATSPDHADAVLADEARELCRHRHRLQRVVRATVDVDRQAGVGDAGDGQRRVRCDVADRLAHVLGSGGAVEADDIDVQRLEDREHRGGVGAEQHPAGDVERHHGHDRNRTRGFCRGVASGEDRGLCLEDVLLRLDDEQIGTAEDERRGLLAIDGHEVREPEPAHRRIARCGQESGRPHAPRDEARAPILRVLVGNPPGELRGGHVQLGGDISLAPLLQARARGLKGAGLDDVAARIEEAPMDALDDLWGVDREAVHPAFQRRAAEVIAGERLRLQAGAHGAVENQHTLAQRIKEGRSISRPHHHDVTRERLRDTLANRPFSFKETLFGPTPTPSW